mmetsp:Transcript_11131/g.23604  ORF Transcript_11131/g.23604 Transcript_11131/m.23604 type:complete len:434 (-) Transcript_11131:1644-2945(-)
MPSFRSNDSFGVNSSLEEANKRSPPTPFTKNSHLVRSINHATLEEERMHRTNNVRERMGPIIKRLKDSVAKVTKIEDSIRQSSDGADIGDDHEVKDLEQDVRLGSMIRAGKSQQLMSKGMERVKKKMLMLKNMEEELAAMEDRSVNLHHYFQREVVSQVDEAPSSSPSENSENRNRIKELKTEMFLLNEKSEQVDGLLSENARMLEKMGDVERLQNELHRERKLRVLLESNLEEHRCEMKLKAAKYDSLEHKFEVSMSTFEILTKALEIPENCDRGFQQELSETIEAIALHRRYLLKNGNPPKMIEHLKTDESAVLTEPMTLSWTEDSSLANDLSTIDNDCSIITEESTVYKSNDFSKGTSCTNQSTFQILRSKIEALERENAELRENKNHALKCISLQEKTVRQSSMIENLQRELDHKVWNDGNHLQTDIRA